jgi:hypothetical protein
VLAWGNGGCAADGAGERFHLAEIASHGYLAIASGTVQSGPGAPPRPADVSENIYPAAPMIKPFIRPPIRGIPSQASERQHSPRP